MEIVEIAATVAWSLKLSKHTIEYAVLLNRGIPRFDRTKKLFNEYKGFLGDESWKSWTI